MFVRCYKRGAARLEHSLLWTCYVLMCVCDLLRAVINSLITAPTVLQTLFTKFHDSWSRRFKLINNINKSAGSVWCYHVNMDKKNLSKCFQHLFESIQWKTWYNKYGPTQYSVHNCVHWMHICVHICNLLPSEWRVTVIADCSGCPLLQSHLAGE